MKGLDVSLWQIFKKSGEKFQQTPTQQPQRGEQENLTAITPVAILHF